MTNVLGLRSSYYGAARYLWPGLQPEHGVWTCTGWRARSQRYSQDPLLSSQRAFVFSCCGAKSPEGPPLPLACSVRPLGISFPGTLLSVYTLIAGVSEEPVDYPAFFFFSFLEIQWSLDKRRLSAVKLKVGALRIDLITLIFHFEMKFYLCFPLFRRQVGLLTVIIERCSFQVVKMFFFFFPNWKLSMLDFNNRSPMKWTNVLIYHLRLKKTFFESQSFWLGTFYQLCIICQVQQSICISCFMLWLLLSNCCLDVWLPKAPGL